MYGELSMNEEPKVTDPQADTIVISIEEYEELLADADWLSALEAAGVDNWEGIDFAHEIYGAFDK